MTVSPVVSRPVLPASSSHRSPSSHASPQSEAAEPEFSGWLNPDPLVNVQTVHGVRQMRLSEAQRLRGGGGGGNNNDGDWWERLKAVVKDLLGL